MNEAFASVVLQFLADTGLKERYEAGDVNPNGGGISLGHPLGATGARITATLVSELERRNARYGIGAMCIGFGQAIAGVVERIYDLASSSAARAPISGAWMRSFVAPPCPLLEVHLTPGESVVAEAGQLGWFDDGIELETSTAMAGSDGVLGCREAKLRRRHVFHDPLHVDDASGDGCLPGAPSRQDLPDSARPGAFIHHPAARVPRRPRGQRALDRVPARTSRLGGVRWLRVPVAEARRRRSRVDRACGRDLRVRPCSRSDAEGCILHTSASSKEVSNTS